MDEICYCMSNLRISSQILLNLDNWKCDHINSQGMYRELITPNTVYIVYLYGEIFAIDRGKPRRIKGLELVERGEDIIVLELNH
jgi:hypothetical protein